MRKTYFRQQGMSLASLLIGLATGSFLIMSIMQVFGTSKQVTSLTKSMGQISQESRFVVYHLDRLISQTGYRQHAESVYNDLGALYNGNHIDYNNEEYKFVASTGPPLNIIDCNGNVVGPNRNQNLRLKKDGDSLLCSSDDSTWVKIIDGNIDEFNMFAQLTDPRFETFRIKDIRELTQEEKLRVIAVRVSILIRTKKDVRLTTDTASYRNVSDAEWSEYNDKKMRHVIEFTVLTPHIYEDLNTSIYNIADTQYPEEFSVFAFNTDNLGMVERPWVQNQ
ncbi:MAG: hypothetical protein HOI53_08825 [Francisellaceae bacterium]|nr:hypothetical protein [Francisellaceae bacterium]MBT6208117.1 hypothetical protein [Francisellaceae bacterium]MBT6538695.1 hypothetical protein [Francisellaceae bacterium]